MGRPVVQYINQASYRATVLGGPVLDLAEPQSLVYANTPKGAVLVAAMYITSPGGSTPQPGGCLTQRHVHTNLCLSKSLGVVGEVSPGSSACPAGSRNRVTQPMMHVWFVPIPGGPTAIDAPEQQVVQAVERAAPPMAPPDARPGPGEAVMAGAARSLPGRPSLRYLKLEAKRRLTSGEFSALYEAQLAVAREHGQPSWKALKELIDGQAEDSHVLPHLRWVAFRFRDAGAPGWAAPGPGELRRHFSDELLGRIPPGDLIATLTGMAADLRGDYVVTARAPLAARVKVADLQLLAAVEADPTHRVTRVRRFPLGSRIAGARGAASAPHAVGDVPGAAREIASGAVLELGLPGLVLAGGGPDTTEWAIAGGWADLDRHEALTSATASPRAASPG